MIALALLLATAQSPPVLLVRPLDGGPPPLRTIFDDSARNVRVGYDFTPVGVIFSAHLPAGWGFSVHIDGNQDGRWGSGPERGAPFSFPTPDRSFGQDSRNGVFCSQYVLTAEAGNPDRIHAASECGELPSRGSVEMTGFDRRMWATIALKLPPTEVFGDRLEAHIQVCVWDTHDWICQHSPRAPLVLRRPDTAAG